MYALSRQHRWLSSFVTSLVLFGTAHADPLTLARVIELARSRAPDVRIAQTRVAESRGALVGARVLLPENPVLEIDAGPRWSNDRTNDLDTALTVPLQLGGRRDKRIASAEAQVERDSSLSRDAQRDAISVALTAYYQTAYAKARVALAKARKRLADELLQTANDRKKAGDVAQLEVNVAAAEVARAESEIFAEQANLARVRGELAIILGLRESESIDVDERLDDRSSFDALVSAPSTERADIAAARAEIRSASSEVSLADARRVPDLSFRIGYRREGSDDVLLGGFAISLPFFERGRGERAQARARRERATIELEQKQSSASVQVDAARGAYRATVDAVKKLDEALPLAVQNEQMSGESYKVGKIDLSTLLLVRREALDTRREHLDRQLEAALAGVELSTAMGVTP
jgi:outer membrane protein, heavy metal efflux system